MTNPPHFDDKEADRRFNETLGRLAKMPPKPHTPSQPKQEEPRESKG